MAIGPKMNRLTGCDFIEEEQAATIAIAIIRTQAAPNHQGSTTLASPSPHQGRPPCETDYCLWAITRYNAQDTSGKNHVFLHPSATFAAHIGNHATILSLW